ncbi:hypothetical protein Q9L42_015970 [Methylomarinum sp. Ch1-1]|uniref:Integrase n=1 Tax=Methylomarinum roseum TaxID=3067653 RepID=A0AAU7NSA7_9GAMM|nr:hypothetical protein [Methylomarinum sp. Ch1-1]MDP4520162.1 hypothetical protein [Methylomarinum sp. Ch1-1]
MFQRYATHQLEDGMPLYQLQHQLGHQVIRLTFLLAIDNRNENREKYR